MSVWQVIYPSDILQYGFQEVEKKKKTHLQSVTHNGKHLHLAAVIVVQQNLCACLHHPKKIPIIGQMKHECGLPSPPADWGQAGPEVINSDISSLAVANCVWLHSTPPLLGLCSIPTPQVSNFDSLTTLISILESSVADIQFLCGENKGWQCSCTVGLCLFQIDVIWGRALRRMGNRLRYTSRSRREKLL